MARQADGTIYVNTAIDSDGFKAGGKEVEAAARKMAKSVNNIGESAKIALQKQTDAFVKQNQAYAAQGKEVEALEKRLDSLIQKQKYFIEMGGSQNSEAFLSTERDIEKLRMELESLKITEDKAIQKTSMMRNTVELIKNSFRNFKSNVTAATKELVRMVGASVSSGIKKLLSSFKKLGKTIVSAGKHTKSTNRSMLKILGTSLLLGTAFRIFSAVINGLKEGVNNLAQYSDDTNKDLSALKSSLTQLKNSFATAFAPILSVVTPILTSFMNTISKVVSHIGMLMAALTGKGTFTKAVAVQEDYAAGLDGVADSAKKAEKAQKGYLSGLDEVAKFSSDAAASTGDGAVTPSEMFEEVTVDNSVADLASVLKEKLTSGDWRGIGGFIAQKLNTVFSAIDFTKAGNKLGEKVKNILNGINGFLQEIDWQMIGRKCAEFVAGIDWSGIASGIFEGVGSALGGIAAAIWGFIEPAWDSVVTWWHDNAYEDGEFTILGLLNGIWEAIKNIGTWIKDNIFTPFINGFKNAFGIHSPSTVMAEMGTYLMEGLFNGITSLVDKVVGIFKDIKTKVSEKWEELKTITAEKWHAISTDLSTKWNDIRKNASSTFSDTKTKIYNIWDSVKSKTTTVWSEVKTTISSVWASIRSKATSFANGIKTAVINAWNTLKTRTSSIWNGIITAIKNPINRIIYFINKMIYGMVCGINDMIGMLNNFSFTIGDKSFGVNIGYLTPSYIPYLASGAVIPPNAPFMAMLGDQKNGRNLEMPEALLRKIVREESGGGRSGGMRFTAQLNRRVLFDEFVEEAKIRQMQTGKNLLELV